MNAPEPPRRSLDGPARPGGQPADAITPTSAPEQWHALRQVVDGALELPDAARTTYLDAMCGADRPMRDGAARLLAACEAVVTDADRVDGLPSLNVASHTAPLVVGCGASTVRVSDGEEAAAHDAFCRALSGRYAVELELGRGGMATVYLAHDVRHDRRVALKVLHPELAAVIGTRRFLAEIRTTAALQHPHILPLFDSGEAAGRLYYVMPYVAGETLRAHLRRDGPLALAEAVRLGREMADALAYAHAQGVVHRDLKPENVLLSGGHAVIADFGVAKALVSSSLAGDAAREAMSRTGARGLTSAGMAVGTPAYMAPEQALGDRATDHRADVYELGVTLYELLAGVPPFVGATPRQIIAAHVTQEPPALDHRRPDVPDALRAVVTRMLAKEPSARPTTMDVVHALDEVSSTLAAAVPSAVRHVPSVPYGRWATRPRWRVLVGLLIAAATVVALGSQFALRDRVPGGGPLEPPFAATPAPLAIAVLPFVNVSGQPENQYFSDGITEEILNRLAQLPGLKVPARSSTFQFAGKAVDVRDIGAKLRVAHVLEGSVQQVGDRIRITTRLVDVRSGYQLWSNQYDRELHNVFAVEDEIAQAIAGALALQFPNGGSARPAGARPAGARSVEPEAHRLYLQGRAVRNFTATSIRAAIDLYRRALERDPSHADAWAALAQSYELLPRYAGEAPAPWLARARAAAERAITLDSTLAEPHGVLAVIHAQEGRPVEAEEEHRRALTLNPNGAGLHASYAIFKLRQANYEAAVREMERARELDPLSTRIHANLGYMLFAAGRPDSAIAVFRDVLREDPAHFFAHAQLAAALAYVGRTAEGVAETQRALEIAGPDVTATDLARIGYALGRAGETRRARQIAADLERRVQAGETDPGAFAPAMVYAGLGDTDRALGWLERGVEDGHFGRPEYPLFDTLRGHARYQALLARLRHR